jgi:hypothetical protein
MRTVCLKTERRRKEARGVLPSGSETALDSTTASVQGISPENEDGAF